MTTTTLCPAAAAASSSSSVSVHPRLLRDRKLNRTRVRCTRAGGGGDKSAEGGSDSNSSSNNNLLLKTAWYGSELLGIAASLFRPPQTVAVVEESNDSIKEAGTGGGVIDRALIVETIKGDFQRSYFVTGALTVDAYEDDCEFADPAGSFKGLHRFKRNCTNFGSLIHKSNMSLLKWEDFQDKGIGHWRFSCTMVFPWKPILSGYTEYYLSNETGKVCRHVEHWNVPKMALFKQLLKPSRQTRPGG